MKNYLSIFIGILCIQTVCYTQTLNVHTNAGAVYSYEIAEIDSITFNLLTYLINDDFEGYAVGSFPSFGGWFERYNGTGINIIDNTHAHSGTNSFRLQGRPGWSANIENHDASWQSNATSMGYEVYIYTDGGDAWISFYDYNPIWGQAWGTLWFTSDGFITNASGATIMPYTFGQWYKMKVQVYNIPPYNYKVWIDDIYKGEYTSTQSFNHSVNESYFTISTGHAGNFIWYDDAKVWYVGSKSNTSQ